MGSRSDEAGRAVAAYIGRRIFGYPAIQVAGVLGYRSTSSVNRAVARVDRGNAALKRTTAKLIKAIELDAH